MEWAAYSSPRATVTKYHKLGGLKQPFFFFFWVGMYSPEVPNQGVVRATVSLKSLGADPSWRLPASGNIPLISLLLVTFSFLQAHQPYWIRPILITSSYLGYICKDSISYIRSYSENTVVRTSAYLFGECNSTHNKLSLWKWLLYPLKCANRIRVSCLSRFLKIFKHQVENRTSCLLGSLPTMAFAHFLGPIVKGSTEFWDHTWSSLVEMSYAQKHTPASKNH